MVKRVICLLVLVSALVLQFQCKTGSSVSFILRLISGNSQTGYMGQVLSQPIIIRIEDREGNPQSGAMVSITVSRGGGSVNGSEGLNTVNISTDSDGNVSILWKLGDEYVNRLRVTLQSNDPEDSNLPSLNIDATSLYVYRQPQRIDDGWETGSLEDSAASMPDLLEMIDGIRSGKYENIHSLLIIKSGKLLLEEYWSGMNSSGVKIDYDRDTKHEVQSASKSFRSALIGIAIDQGFIPDEDQPLFSFFPEHQNLNNEMKNRITLKHVLTMSSGFEWHENDVPFSDPANDLSQMYSLPSYQWTRYVLERPMAAEPGTRWLYNTGASLILSDILTRTTGMRADFFADRYLFNKVESKNVADNWPPLGTGLIPRDMAKLGQVYLNNGMWKGNRIVSEAWVRISTQTHFTVNASSEYGYLWWRRSFYLNGQTISMFYAAGNGGQYIFVYPSLDMVVVFTGGNFNSNKMNEVYDLLRDYLLPAFLSNDN